MAIDTRDVNELGPGKFRTSSDNREKQTCYSNKNKSDTHFTSFFAKQTQVEPIKFSIVKPNFNFEVVNKSLEVDLNKSVANGQLKRQLQQVSSEDFNIGRSYRSEITEPTNVQQQQCGGLYRRNSRGQSATRKKPRYLSAADTS